MQNKKRKMLYLIIFILPVVVILPAVVLFQLRYHILTVFNHYIPPHPAQLNELSPEEKEADFQYCYESLLYGHPAINDYAEIFGTAITGKYDKYKTLIKNTNNNYEFFCVMDAFMQEIPSFHTDLVFPEKNAYAYLQCFGSKRISADRGTLSSAVRWHETIMEGAERFQDAVFYSYECIDGSYWFVDHSGNEDFVLIDAGGIPVDEYITSAVSPYRLWYDGKNEKLCRTRIVFNDRYGEEIRIKVRDRNGTESSKTVFASLYAEEAYRLGALGQEESRDDVMIDQIGDICHIRLNNMLVPSCIALSRAMKDNAHQKIILDLRENYGGNEHAISDLLHPLFFADEKEVTKEWYMPSYGVNEVAYRDVFSRLLYKLSKKTDGDGTEIILSESRKAFRGKAGNAEKRIVILISHKTGSAADEFVNVTKGRNNALIIGNNTGGEGLMGTFAADVCPNSQLVFVYMPSRVSSDDMNEYVTKGTAPDVYVSNTIEDYKGSGDSVLEEAIRRLGEN